MSASSKKPEVGEDSGEVGAAASEAAVVDGGPGLIYMPFVVMEDLLDKLKLLNYEEVSFET